MQKNLEYENTNIDTTGKRRKAKSFNRNIATYTKLFLSFILLVVSFTLILLPQSNTLLLSLISVVSGIMFIYLFFIMTNITNKFIRMSLLVLLLIAGGLLVYFVPNFLVILFIAVTSILGLITSAFLFLNVWRHIKIGLPYFKFVILGIIYFIFSTVLILAPFRERLLALLVAIYFLWLCFSFGYEAISSLTHRKSNRTNFVVTLPTFISFIIPIAIYKILNRRIRKEPDEVLAMQESDVDEEPDLFIYIHLRAGLQPGLGHVDFCYKDKIYSYGDYDQKSSRLFGLISDGVLATLPKKIHTKFEVRDGKKIMLSYGLKLTDEQKTKIEEKLESIMSKCYKWEPKVVLKDGTKVVLSPDTYVDDDSVIHLNEIAHFYKFEHGSRYEIYSGVSENCAKLINDLVGVTGIKLKKFNGIISPGAYLEYLDELYSMEDTIVVERRIYSMNADGHPLEYPAKAKGPFKLFGIIQ